MGQRRTLYSLLLAAGNAVVSVARAFNGANGNNGNGNKSATATGGLSVSASSRCRSSLIGDDFDLVFENCALAVRLNNSGPVSDSSDAAGASAVWVKSVVQRDIERNLTHAACEDHS